jgi:hypothetical protein
MSSYADKRNRRPGCRVEDCTSPGTTLFLRFGVLGWYCEQHTEHKNK